MDVYVCSHKEPTAQLHVCSMPNNAVHTCLCAHMQDEALRRLEFIKQKEVLMSDPMAWSAVPPEVGPCAQRCEHAWCTFHLFRLDPLVGVFNRNKVRLKLPKLLQLSAPKTVSQWLYGLKQCKGKELE